jgi:hypothetical protein
MIEEFNHEERAEAALEAVAESIFSLPQPESEEVKINFDWLPRHGGRARELVRYFRSISESDARSTSLVQSASSLTPAKRHLKVRGLLLFSSRQRCRKLRALKHAGTLK